MSMTQERLGFSGTYTLRRVRDGLTVRARNTLTWTAVNDLMLNGLTAREWRVGLKQGGEGSAYDTPASRVWTDAPFNASGTKPVWTPASAAAGLINNVASPARVVIEQDTLTDGVYIISSDGEVILSVAEWYATQELLAGDEFTVTYEIDAGPA